jgi:hypothetical protein
VVVDSTIALLLSIAEKKKVERGDRKQEEKIRVTRSAIITYKTLI